MATPLDVPVRVRYAETDQMGVVHHSVYPVWFEAARTELSRAVGMPYARWEQRGILLMVAELECRYRRPARYDDVVVVRVAVAELASRRVTFEYTVRAEDGTILAEGTTRHLVVSRETGRPAVLPPDLRAALERDPTAESRR